MKKLLIILLLFIVSACLPSKPSENLTSECIPPLFDIAYPVVTHQPENDIKKEIPPQGDWKEQVELPLTKDNGAELIYRSQQNELWFIDYNDYKVYRYSINENHFYSYSIIDSIAEIPSQLFISSDGSVWGIENISAGKYDGGKSLLSQFDDTSNSFKYVENTSNLFTDSNIEIISEIVEDQFGNFWFFVYDRRKEAGITNQILMSFDPNSHETKKHYSIVSGGSNELVIGPDGSVWFIKSFENVMVQYLPSLGKIREYSGYLNMPIDSGGLPIDFSNKNLLFIDHKGNLWIENSGWLDFSDKDKPVWNQIIESSVFLTKAGLPENEYLMANSQLDIFQSSNDWLWFSNGAGIVRLDNQNHSWCLITTAHGNVVEDNTHNLWIAVLGHLYKYELKNESLK